MTLRVALTEDGYLLEASSGTSIKLTMEEALELAQVARQLQDHIRSQHRHSRLFPVSSAGVEDIILSLDAHLAQVVLRLVQQGGLETCYVVSLDSSRRLRDGLTTKIEQIETAQRNRNPQ